MTTFANGTEFLMVGGMKASTMMKVVEEYMRLDNNTQLKFSFDKYKVVHTRKKTLTIFAKLSEASEKLNRAIGIDEERENKTKIITV